MILARLTVILCVIFISLGCKNPKRINKSPISEYEINNSIQKFGISFLGNESISSISIGIYKEGKSFSGHFGILDKSNRKNPNDSTLYNIASISKTMTGTLVAKAVIEKKINLEADIRDYLDGVYLNLEYMGTPIKVKHLLTHMSGLKTDPKGYDLMFEQNDYTIKYPKEAFFKDLRSEIIDTTPGTKYNYSNIGALLVSYALENVYHKSFETLLSENILDKSNMKQTFLKLDDNTRKNLVLGNLINGEKAPFIPFCLTGAEGQVKSTILDMINYIKYHLDGNNPIVNESHEIVNKERWMGYFWQIWDDGDTRILQHFGNSPGTTTYLAIYPKYDLGISVITNVRGANNILYDDLVVKLLDDLRPSGKSVYNVLKKIKTTSLKEKIEVYNELKMEYPTLYNFSAGSDFYKFGYDYLNRNRINDAIRIFNFNADEHPESYYSFYHLAEAYFKNENYPMALINYKKCIELNPNYIHAIKKIERIKSIQY